MNFLFAGLVSLFSQVVAFFGLQLSKKTIFAAALIASFTALTATFVAAVKALVVGLVYAMPPWASQGFAMLIPGNLSLCLGALMSAKVAMWIYRFHTKSLELVAGVS